MSQATYILGSSPRELSRLSLQARIIGSTTERLLRQAGIRRGMRVLDLGCGAGDVSMLAAELVGRPGSVVGIDRSAEAIERARARVDENGFERIDFYESSLDGFSSTELFDVVIGRYVLIHQAAPAEFIRAASRHVRPGGVIAFHEVCCHREFRSLPESPLFEQMGKLCRVAACLGFLSPDAAGRLVEHFLNAGLPQPKLFGEMPVGSGMDSELIAWIAETMASVKPLLLERGLTTEEEMSIDTLEERLRAEVLAMRSQIEIPMQMCAWARLL